MIQAQTMLPNIFQFYRFWITSLFYIDRNLIHIIQIFKYPYFLGSSITSDELVFPSISYLLLYKSKEFINNIIKFISLLKNNLKSKNNLSIDAIFLLGLLSSFIKLLKLLEKVLATYILNVDRYKLFPKI